MTPRKSRRTTIEEELFALELRCANRDRVDELLEEDFAEIGSSGAVYDKGQTLAAIARQPEAELAILDFGVRLIAPRVALVTYCAGGSLRSSIWVRRDGAWRILFHQGTPSSCT